MEQDKKGVWEGIPVHSKNWGAPKWIRGEFKEFDDRPTASGVAPIALLHHNRKNYGTEMLCRFAGLHPERYDVHCTRSNCLAQGDGSLPGESLKGIFLDVGAQKEKMAHHISSGFAPKCPPDNPTCDHKITFAYGLVEVNNEWQKVVLPRSVENPVVITTITSRNDKTLSYAYAEISKISEDSFYIRIRIPDHKNDECEDNEKSIPENTPTELVNYLVAKVGWYDVGEGWSLAVGKTGELKKRSGRTFSNIKFENLFSKSFKLNPALIAQVQSSNTDRFIYPAITSVYATHFNGMFHNAYANNKEQHSESFDTFEGVIGFIAMEQDKKGVWEGIPVHSKNWGQEKFGPNHNEVIEVDSPQIGKTAPIALVHHNSKKHKEEILCRFEGVTNLKYGLHCSRSGCLKDGGEVPAEEIVKGLLIDVGAVDENLLLNVHQGIWRAAHDTVGGDAHSELMLTLKDCDKEKRCRLVREDNFSLSAVFPENDIKNRVSAIASDNTEKSKPSNMWTTVRVIGDIGQELALPSPGDNQDCDE
eukprot:GHVN01085079.1.p1 GENE.GHVN01085079.1~~GHVN01085079.1.p1  ORF type:complete len:542 (-),score=70.28 GHVN01085079.1:17-1612(-)